MRDSSPSTRREWIEICDITAPLYWWKSPSTRREWIEILTGMFNVSNAIASPSTRREWIEIEI